VVAPGAAVVVGDAALVVVVVASVVVVLPPGAVVVVDDALALVDAGGRFARRTGRNRSSAVRPTSCSAFVRSFTPGRSTTMSLPWRLISGSATPRLSTQLRMMSTATSRELDLNVPTGDRITE